ncbi:MAG: hypothetical protein AAFV88_11900 [Planctomycetota bacterium]
MSTSNESQLPEANDQVAALQIDSVDWSSLTEATHSTRGELETWLGEQLTELESSLEAFVTKKSRYKGRR